MLITDVAKKLINSADPANLARSLAQIFDLKTLSQDLAAALTERAIKQKDLIIEALAREFSSFLSQINIADEAQKILKGMTLNIQASVDFNGKKHTGKEISFHSRRSTKSSKRVGSTHRSTPTKNI